MGEHSDETSQDETDHGEIEDGEIEEIEAERRRRLAPENRPENAEIDNTGENMPEVAKD